MATPTILIEQAGQAAGTAGQSRTDLVTGSLVTLSDPANGGVGTHTWAIAVPYGSAAALSSTSAASPTFTPDVVGTYLIYLQVDVDYSYTIDANGQRNSTQGGAAVLHTNGTRALGKGETGQFGNWSDTFHGNFATIDNATVLEGAAQGSIFQATSGGLIAPLAPGASGEVLTSAGAGADLVWAAAAGGGGSSTLQEVYDAGHTATTLSADPFVITSGGGFGLSVVGDAKVSGATHVGAGTEANPSIVNITYPTTGISFPSANSMSLSTNGTAGLNITSTQGLRAKMGSATDTAYGFVNDTTSGLYSNGTGQINFATANYASVSISGTGVRALTSSGGLGTLGMENRASNPLYPTSNTGRFWVKTGSTGNAHTVHFSNGDNTAFYIGGNGGVRTVAASTTLDKTDKVIAVVGSSSAVAITLPAASAVEPSVIYYIKCGDGGAVTYNITITRAGSDTIDGATTSVISTAHGVKQITSDGSSRWYIL